MAIIEVNRVTKEFQLGQLQTLKLGLQRMLARMSGRELPERKKFKALDDVDFKIDESEVVGIIGHNGAGKSTLLKILSRITVPSNGSVKVRGRVAPLIEVGAGLVGDLTGRENIYLNAAILGMSKKEISRKFDEIVAFSELEEFLDTPIKRYSSGMSVRLGFSIATSVDADILIVDEVLAVGDLAFQRKCIDRMESLISRSGRTILLVSHNIRQIHRMCTRVLLLDHGRLAADGDSERVCSLFYEQANAKVAHDKASSTATAARIDSSGELDLQSIDIVDAGGNKTGVLRCGDELRTRVRFRTHEWLTAPQFIVGTHTTDFVYLSAGSTGAFESRPDLLPGMHEVEYVLPTFPLAPGVYCLRFSVYDGKHRPIFIGEALSTFRVTTASVEVREPGSRLLHIPGRWRLDGQDLPAPSGSPQLTFGRGQESGDDLAVNE